MPGGPSGFRLLQVAQKTLSRDEDDHSAVPDHYLRVLLRHLEKYPDEDNFLMDLQDSGGTLICLHCMTEIPVANREGQLENLDAFWVSFLFLLFVTGVLIGNVAIVSAFQHHIGTQGHQTLCSHSNNSGAVQDASMNVEMGFDHAFDSTPAPLNPPGRDTTTRRRVMKTAQFSDGEVFEYSTDEDDTMLSYPPVGNIPPYNPLNRQESCSNTNTSSHYNSPFNNSSSIVSPFNPSTNNYTLPPLSQYYMTPKCQAGHPHILNSNNYNSFAQASTTRTASQPTVSFPPTSSTSSSSFSGNAVKRTRRGTRRLVFPDGDVIYVSTDDEDVDERPPAHPSKKARFGGALIKSGSGAHGHCSCIYLFIY